MSLRAFAFILAVASFSSLPALAQRCSPATLADTVCDCGCNAVDSACTANNFSVCVVSHCPAGSVPWEHGPAQCMNSSCGDGWRDEATEACDDGNALASGGCNATCSAVNPGYTCGSRAEGCRVAPVDAGTGGGGGAATGGGTGTGGGASGGGAGGGATDGVDAGPGTPVQQGGCTSVPLLGLAWLGLVLARRQRRA